MVPRPDVSADRKQQILDAAAKVFAKLGFQRARMDDIVAASGLSKGALYWYYASKDEIIVGLLDKLFGGSVAQLEAALDRDEPVPALLRELVKLMLEDVQRTQALIPITFEFYAVAMRSKAVRKYVRAFYLRYRRNLGRLLARGQERGELDPELDPSIAALGFVALFEGLTLMWIIDPEGVRFPHDLVRAGEQAIRSMEAPRTRRGKEKR